MQAALGAGYMECDSVKQEIPIPERWILIGTGEGASSAVVSDLREGLHRFMCCCKTTLDVCKDETVLWVLQDIMHEDNWQYDGRKAVRAIKRGRIFRDYDFGKWAMFAIDPRNASKQGGRFANLIRKAFVIAQPEAPKEHTK